MPTEQVKLLKLSSGRDLREISSNPGQSVFNTYGKKTDSQYLGDAMVFPSQDEYQEEKFAQVQPNLDKMGNALVKLSLGTAAVTGQGIGSLYGIGSALAHWDITKLSENSVSDPWNKLKDWVDNEYVQYATTEEKNSLTRFIPFGKGSSSVYFGSLADGAAFILGSYIPGIGAGKLVGAITNATAKGLMGAAKTAGYIDEVGRATAGAEALAYKTLTNSEIPAIALNSKNFASRMAKASGVLSKSEAGIVDISTDILAAHNEATIEANEGRKKYVNDRIDEITNATGVVPTDAELDRIEEESKDLYTKRYGLNLAIVSASNIAQFGNAFKTRTQNTIERYGKIKETLKKGADDVYSYEAAKLPKYVAWLKYPGVEALEEGSQFTVEKALDEYYKDRYYNPNKADLGSSILHGIEETFGTTEGWDNMMAGFILGGIGGGGVRSATKEERGDSKSLLSRIKFDLGETGFGKPYAEAKEKAKDAATLVDFLNKRDEHLSILFNGLASNKASEEKIVKLLRESDPLKLQKALKDEEYGQLITTILTAYETGQSQWLLDSIKEQAAKYTKDEAGIDEYKQRYGVPGQNLDPNKSDQIVIGERASKISNIIKKVETHYKDVDTLFPNISDNQKRDYIFTLMTSEDSKRRLLSVYEDIKTLTGGLLDPMAIRRVNNPGEYQSALKKAYQENEDALVKGLSNLDIKNLTIKLNDAFHLEQQYEVYKNASDYIANIDKDYEEQIAKKYGESYLKNYERVHELSRIREIGNREVTHNGEKTSMMNMYVNYAGSTMTGDDKVKYRFKKDDKGVYDPHIIVDENGNEQDAANFFDEAYVPEVAPVFAEGEKTPEQQQIEDLEKAKKSKKVKIVGITTDEILKYTNESLPKLEKGINDAVKELNDLFEKLDAGGIRKESLGSALGNITIDKDGNILNYEEVIEALGNAEENFQAIKDNIIRAYELTDQLGKSLYKDLLAATVKNPLYESFLSDQYKENIRDLEDLKQGTDFIQSIIDSVEAIKKSLADVEPEVILKEKVKEYKKLIKDNRQFRFQKTAVKKYINYNNIALTDIKFVSEIMEDNVNHIVAFKNDIGVLAKRDGKYVLNILDSDASIIITDDTYQGNISDLGLTPVIVNNVTPANANNVIPVVERIEKGETKIEDSYANFLTVRLTKDKNHVLIAGREFVFDSDLFYDEHGTLINGKAQPVSLELKDLEGNRIQASQPIIDILKTQFIIEDMLNGIETKISVVIEDRNYTVIYGNKKNITTYKGKLYELKFKPNFDSADDKFLGLSEISLIDNKTGDIIYPDELKDREYIKMLNRAYNNYNEQIKEAYNIIAKELNITDEITSPTTTLQENESFPASGTLRIIDKEKTRNSKEVEREVLPQFRYADKERHFLEKAIKSNIFYLKGFKKKINDLKNEVEKQELTYSDPTVIDNKFKFYTSNPKHSILDIPYILTGKDNGDSLASRAYFFFSNNYNVKKETIIINNQEIEVEAIAVTESNIPDSLKGKLTFINGKRSKDDIDIKSVIIKKRKSPDDPIEPIVIEETLIYTSLPFYSLEKDNDGNYITTSFKKKEDHGERFHMNIWEHEKEYQDLSAIASLTTEEEARLEELRKERNNIIKANIEKIIAIREVVLNSTKPVKLFLPGKTSGTPVNNEIGQTPYTNTAYDTFFSEKEKEDIGDLLKTYDAKNAKQQELLDRFTFYVGDDKETVSIGGSLLSIRNGGIMIGDNERKNLFNAAQRKLHLSEAEDLYTIIYKLSEANLSGIKTNGKLGIVKINGINVDLNIAGGFYVWNFGKNTESYQKYKFGIFVEDDGTVNIKVDGKVNSFSSSDVKKKSAEILKLLSNFNRVYNKEGLTGKKKEKEEDTQDIKDKKQKKGFYRATIMNGTVRQFKSSNEYKHYVMFEKDRGLTPMVIFAKNFNTHLSTFHNEKQFFNKNLYFSIVSKEEVTDLHKKRLAEKRAEVVKNTTTGGTSTITSTPPISKDTNKTVDFIHKKLNVIMPDFFAGKHTPESLKEAFKDITPLMTVDMMDNHVFPSKSPYRFFMRTLDALVNAQYFDDISTYMDDYDFKYGDKFKINQDYYADLFNEEYLKKGDNDLEGFENRKARRNQAEQIAGRLVTDPKEIEQIIKEDEAKKEEGKSGSIGDPVNENINEPNTEENNTVDENPFKDTENLGFEEEELKANNIFEEVRKAHFGNFIYESSKFFEQVGLKAPELYGNDFEKVINKIANNKKISSIVKSALISRLLNIFENRITNNKTGVQELIEYINKNFNLNIKLDSSDYETLSNNVEKSNDEIMINVMANESLTDAEKIQKSKENTLLGNKWLQETASIINAILSQVDVTIPKLELRKATKENTASISDYDRKETLDNLVANLKAKNKNSHKRVMTVLNKYNINFDDFINNIEDYYKGINNDISDQSFQGKPTEDAKADIGRREEERLSNKQLASSVGEINTGNIEIANLPTGIIDKTIANDDKGNPIKVHINYDNLNGVLLSRNGKVLFRAMQGRFFIIAKVGDFYLPFYISSAGTSGKNAGEWYPFFGFNNWLVKGSVGKKGEMEYTQKVDEITNLLNENLQIPAKYFTQFGQITNGKGTPVNPDKVFYDINNDLAYESWFVEFDRKNSPYTEEQFVFDRTGLNPKGVKNDGKGSADDWIRDVLALTENAPLASKGKINAKYDAEIDALKQKTTSDNKNETTTEKVVPTEKKGFGAKKSKYDENNEESKGDNPDFSSIEMADNAYHFAKFPQITDINTELDNIQVMLGLSDDEKARLAAIVYNNSEGLFMSNGDILLKQTGVIGRGYHEAFHKVFRMYMTDAESNYLINLVKKKYPNYTDIQAEERLAEEFRYYMLTGKVNPELTETKGFIEAILAFIEKLLGLNLESRFKKIKEGGFSTLIPITNRFTNVHYAVKMEGKEIPKFRDGLSDEQEIDEMSDLALSKISNYLITDVISFSQDINKDKEFIKKLITDAFNDEEFKKTRYGIESGNYLKANKLFIKDLYNEIVRKLNSVSSLDLEKVEEEEGTITKEKSNNPYVDAHERDFKNSIPKPVKFLLLSIKDQKRTNLIGLPKPISVPQMIRELYNGFANMSGEANLTTKLREKAKTDFRYAAIIERLSLDKPNLDPKGSNNRNNLKQKFFSAITNTKHDMIGYVMDDNKKLKQVRLQDEQIVSSSKQRWLVNLRRTGRDQSGFLDVTKLPERADKQIYEASPAKAKEFADYIGITLHDEMWKRKETLTDLYAIHSSISYSSITKEKMRSLDSIFNTKRGDPNTSLLHMALKGLAIANAKFDTDIVSNSLQSASKSIIYNLTPQSSLTKTLAETIADDPNSTYAITAHFTPVKETPSTPSMGFLDSFEDTKELSPVDYMKVYFKDALDNVFHFFTPGGSSFENAVRYNTNNANGNSGFNKIPETTEELALYISREFIPAELAYLYDLSTRSVDGYINPDKKVKLSDKYESIPDVENFTEKSIFYPYIAHLSNDRVNKGKNGVYANDKSIKEDLDAYIEESIKIIRKQGLSENEMSDDLLTEAICKQMAINLDISKSVFGSLSIYKEDPYKFFKRVSMANGPKEYFTPDVEFLTRFLPRNDNKRNEDRANLAFLVINELKKQSLPDNIIEQLKEAMGSKSANKYTLTEYADGTVLIKLDGYRDLMSTWGEWWDKDEANYYRELDGELVNEDNSNFAYVNSQKGQFFANNADGVPYSSKSAIMPTVNSQFKENHIGTQIIKLLDEKNLDGIVLPSTVKNNPLRAEAHHDLFIETKNPVTNKTEVTLNTNVRDISIVQFPLKDFGRQVVTDVKNSSKTSLSVQMNKNIISGLYDSGEIAVKSWHSFNILEDKPVAIDNESDAKTYVNNLINNLNESTEKQLEIRYYALLKKLGLKDVNGEISLSKEDFENLKATVLEAAGNNGVSANIINNINLAFSDEGYAKYEFIMARETIEHLLNSIVRKNLIERKINGKQAILGSSFMYGNLRKFTQEDLDEGLEELAPYIQNEEGKYTEPLEVYLPHHFREKFGIGAEIDLNNVDPRLLRVLGTRIPNQALSSIESVKIKGFLPQTMGDIVITPAVMVTKSGHDFDVDKLNLYFFNSYVNEGRHVPFVKTDDPEVIAKQLLASKTTRNALRARDSQAADKLDETLATIKDIKKRLWENNSKLFESKDKWHKLADLKNATLAANPKANIDQIYAFKNDLDNEIERLTSIVQQLKENLLQGNAFVEAFINMLPKELVVPLEVHENEMLNIQHEIFLTQSNFSEMYIPNSQDTINDAAEKHGHLHENEITNKKWGYFRHIGPLNHILYALTNREAAQLIAIAAKATVSHSQSQLIGIKLKKALPILGKYTNGLSFSSRYVKTSTGEESTITISDLIQQVLSGVVDAEKGDAIIKVNLNNITINAYLLLLNNGVHPENIFALINNKYYLESIALWRSKNGNKGYSAYLKDTVAHIKDQEPLDFAKINSYSREQILSYMIDINEYQSEQISLNRFLSPDTVSFNNQNDVYYFIEEFDEFIEDSKMFNTEGLRKIETDITVSSFYKYIREWNKINDRFSLFSDVDYGSKTVRKLKDYIKDKLKYKNAKIRTSAYKKVDTSLITAILQNFGRAPINRIEELFKGDKSLPMRFYDAIKPHDKLLTYFGVSSSEMKDNISLLTVRPSVEEANEIANLLHSVISKDEKLFYDLLDFMIIQSGVQISPINFINFINSTYVLDNTVESLNDYSNDPDQLLNTFIPNFFLNNSTDNSLVPLLDHTRGVPKGTWAYKTEKDAKEIYVSINQDNSFIKLPVRNDGIYSREYWTDIYQRPLLRNTDNVKIVKEIPVVKENIPSTEVKKGAEEVYSKLGKVTKSEHIQIVDKPYEYSDEQKKGNAVVAYKSTKIPASFENPFHTSGKSTKENVIDFIDFVLNSNEPQAQWIREQLKSGKFKGKPIYYGNTAANKANEPSHATALDYLINKYDWNTEVNNSKVEVTKVIAGGQHGGDLGGLKGAKRAGIETGGTAPPGFIQYGKGSQKALLQSYGLVEGEYDPQTYPKRTMKNVDDADGTVAVLWGPSTGTEKTIGYAQSGKWERGTTSKDNGYSPVLVIKSKDLNSAVKELQDFIKRNNIETLNVAGHRETSQPGIEAFTEELIYRALTENTDNVKIVKEIPGVQELVDYLKQKYPEIKLDISNNPIWEQDDSVFNQEENISDLELFTEDNKLCARGICNYTAKFSTEHLQKIGLNPYPANYNGSQLPVSVNSPLGDFKIEHYVSAVAINNNIYIYDMPQNEFISDSFFGKDSDVKLTNTYKPRLIPLNLDSIQSAYNLNVIDAGKFISYILNNSGWNGANAAPSFKEYIKKNIKNSEEYINLLEAQIKNSGYEFKQWNVEEFRKEIIDRKTDIKNKKITTEEEKAVIKYYENKLKLKTKEYLPKKEDKFSLKTFIQSVIGDTFNNKIDYSSFENALKSLEIYLKSEEFVEDLLNKYTQLEDDLNSINNSISNVYRIKILMEFYSKQVKIYGIEEAVKQFDKKQQYEIRTLLQSNVLDKYKSKEQAALLINKYWSNKDNVVKQFNIFKTKTFSELLLNKFKNYSKFNKYKTVLNFLKSTDFNADYLYQVISNEAIRKYKYFETKGNLQFQKDEFSRIIGQANIKAMTVLVDAINKKADTIPHEYAHHYIAWFRNTPIVQEAIKKWGSEEALVQSIGEQVVKQKGKAYDWWKKFTDYVMDLFNILSTKDKQELTNILTDAFLSGIDLENNNVGISRERSKELASKAFGIFNQEESTIKPGVEELFETDSNLANEIYEALGFETELPSVDNIIETENKKDKKEKLNKRRELVLKEINAIEELISTNPDEITIYYTALYENDYQQTEYFDKTNWEQSTEKYKTSKVISKPSYLHSHLDEELQKRVKNLQVINSSLYSNIEEINYSNIFQIGKNYSSLEILKYISNNKKDVLSSIAEKLLKYSEKNNVEVSILEKGEKSNVAGSYSSLKNKIEIYGKKSITSHTLIHEIVHSLSVIDINLNPDSKQVKSLKNILKNILDKKILKEYENFESSYEDYATKNIKELLSEIISRPDILSHLALYDTNYDLITSKYKKETLLDEIIKIISDIFNFTKRESETLADAILLNAVEIFENSRTTSNYQSTEITPQQKATAQQLYSQYLESLNKSNTNPILKGNQEAVITPNDKIVFGHPGIGKTFLRESGRTDVIDFDSDYKSRINEEFGLEKGFKARNAFQKSNKEEYQKAVRKLWIEAKKEAKNKGKQLFASDMILLREFANDFDKVITMSKETFVSRAKQRNDYTPGAEGTEGWKQSLDTVISNVDKSKVVSTDKYLSDLFTNTQQEQVKKFAELQERLNNKEFLEGAKNAFESSEELQNAYYEVADFNKPLDFYEGDTLKIDDKTYTISEKISSKELAKRNGLTISSNVPVYIVNEPLGLRKGGYDTVNNIIILSKNSDKETIHHELIHSVEYNLDKKEIEPLYQKVKNTITEDSFNDFVSWNFKKSISEFIADALSKKVFRDALKKEGLLEEIDNILSVYNQQITPQQKLDALNAYTDYIARVSLGIIKNPSSGEYNYESKVKDIVYHSRFNVGNIKNKDRWKNGFYSGTKDQADLMADMAETGSNDLMTTSALLINMQNPKVTTYTDRKVEDYKNTNDSFIIEATEKDALQLIGDRDGYNTENFKKEYVVFEPEQIHILGSKQDIEGFKKFVEQPITEQTVNKEINDIDNYKGTGISKEDWDSLSTKEKEVLLWQKKNCK